MRKHLMTSLFVAMSAVGFFGGIIAGVQPPRVASAQQFQVVQQAPQAPQQAQRPRGAIPSPAFVAAMGQPPVPAKNGAVMRPRGAIPTPRAKIFAAPKHQIRSGVPSSYFVIPSKLSYWLNDTDGDCVTAEEAFAKAASSVMLGLPEIFIPDSSVQQWAKARGYLNGANLTDVMDSMSQQGLLASDGKTYGDGPYAAVDYTNDAVLRSAIFTGPVKIGVAADQLQNTVGQTNGWIGTGWRTDQNEDHCVSLCGFGTMTECCAALNVAVPSGVNATGPAYLLFTWNTIGIVDQSSMIAITSEAWVRNPTTPGLTPAPNPNPDPNPNPNPNPTPTPVPSTTMLYVGFDSTNKTVMLPIGWTARTGLAPLQINAHLGSNFVAVPSGWSAITSVPVVGSE